MVSNGFALKCLKPIMILRIAFKILYFFGWCRALAWDWLPLSYLFCHLMMLTFGIWVVIQPSSHDANQMVKSLSSNTII